MPTQVLGADGKPQAATVAGSWTDLEANTRLRAATNSPAYGAILRADYFIQAALTPTRYYEFSGIPDTEEAFHKQFGIDDATVAKLSAQLGANLVISAITEKPRRAAQTAHAVRRLLRNARFDRRRRGA